MSTITLFTPIESSNKVQTFIDDYFHICGQKAVIVHIDPNLEEAVLLNSSSSLPCSCLKIVSYCTVILPLIMLVAKVISRCMSPTYEIDPLSKYLNDENQYIDAYGQTVKEMLVLYDFHGRRGSTTKPSNPIMNPLELDALIADLQIDWDERLELDSTLYPDSAAPYIEKANTLIFKEAFRNFIGLINSQVRYQVLTRNGATAQKRVVKISDVLEKIDEGSSYFYSDAKQNWAGRFLQILVDHGYIFCANEYEFQA